MEILRETTEWDFPNHTYLVNEKNQLVAFQNGFGIQVLKKPINFDKRYRKFVKVENIELSKVSKAVKQSPVDTDTSNKIEVKGSTGKSYYVETTSGKYACTCPGYGFRSKCKHSEQIKEAQVVELLKESAYEDEYDYLIPKAVAESKRFGLTGDPTPMVVDTFYT